MKIKFSLLTFLLVLIPCIAFAKPNVSFSIEPDHGTLDTEFLAQVTISGSDFSDVETPQFEESEEIEMTYLSNSLQQQILNGSVSFQKTFIFKLEFKKAISTGIHNIPHGLVTVDNEKFRLPSRTITIETAHANNNLNKLAASNNNGFQFVQFVTNDNPYVGEQVVYRVEIIAPDNLEKANLEEFEPQGVWRERYGKDEKKVRRVQNTSISSFSESLFPIQAGNITIPERTLRAAVREFTRKQRSPFSFGNGGGISNQLFNTLMPFFDQFRTVEKTITAPSINLKVKPLPLPPTPINGFIPVGSIKVNSSFDSQSSEVGEPITLTIQVSGDANLRPLEIKNPENFNKKEFKRYDDKPIYSKVIGVENMTSYKTFKISLVPLKPGFLKIPSFKINWFNPNTKTYESYSTEENSVRITGEEIEYQEEQTQEPESIENKEEIKRSTSLKDFDNINYSLGKKNTAYAILIGITAYLFSILNLIVSNKKTSSYLSNKRFIVEFRNKLLNFDLGKDNNEDIINLLKSYLISKHKIENIELTSIELLNKLKGKLNIDSLNTLKLIFNECDQIKFSGASLNNETVSKIKDFVRKH